MALAIKVASLDGLDDATKGMYIKDGEQFRLDIEGYEDPVSLKNALERERTSAKDATRTLRETLKKYEVANTQKIYYICSHKKNSKFT